ncbi:phosphoserine phosphatase SerB [Paraperlucidibaca wandonensis]|jgi:phosphoserine phosphatase|uniref:Phosphoserine phosphatase n=1 Tax=Paraperlucidibaca wandonensis TaxID=1268273 RepID=A0ABW3HGB6_9GAMM|nr:phosphoserine phosphatase SerB [Paraperlucidibaca sp.]|tara:strand:- start:3450 stop:4673 length:1224 start_codon:yes stop_codon:yes gene_type:complete
MREILLVSISGPDRPGISAALTEALASHKVSVLDVSQAVIHDQLTLGLVIETGGEQDSAILMRAVLFKAHALGLQARFTPISADSYHQWVSGHGKARYIFTVLARKITAEHLAAMTKLIAEQGLNIDGLQRLSGRVPLEGEGGEKQAKACVEFSVRGEPKSADALRAELLRLAGEHGIDIAFQKDNAFRRNRRLVCFDMDSTLIEHEVIDELAMAAGVGAQVAAITERAMLGELDFTQSFESRVALLKGLDASVLESIAQSLKLTEGAEHLMLTLKALGYKTAILSGGFNYFGEYLQRKLGIDYVFANQLEIEDGKVTGRVTGQVVDGARKAELLKMIAEKEGVNLEQVIAVGDGANDLPMLSIAGLGIAFRAKPLVRANAKQAISTLGLDGILYLLGVRDRDLDLI